MDRKRDESNQEFGSGAFVANEEVWGLAAGVGGEGKMEERAAGSE